MTKKTPCEKKGYKVEQVFEIVEDGDKYFQKGAIVVLVTDDGSDWPKFQQVSKADMYHSGLWYASLDSVVRIYPPEEKTPAETINLFGKNYVKADIEDALRGVLPLAEWS